MATDRVRGASAGGAMVHVRLYGELNDFLQPPRRHSTLACTVEARVSVKDLVEALGVPHPEIAVILVNGEPTDFDRLVGGGDRVAVYPDFTLLPVPPDIRVGPPPSVTARFVADVHLGRLAAYLRLTGFDTLYRNNFTDPELVDVSAREDRILLTRDVGVLKHRAVRRGHWMRSMEPARQLVEVLRTYRLEPWALPFSRCLRCNTVLSPAAKANVVPLLSERTREHYHEFSACDSCGRIYWKGSHYERMARLVRLALAAARSSGNA